MGGGILQEETENRVFALGSLCFLLLKQNRLFVKHHTSLSTFSLGYPTFAHGLRMSRETTHVRGGAWGNNIGLGEPSA
jgi:hypothetical protein